ncbi:MAG TPA: exosortase/archaeosortase family protein [Nitrospira sp.]|nr:exosortase/archaeosortase family protein [Nitrospira sp.]
MRSPWLACFERRDICFLFLVTACIVWYWRPLALVFTGSLHDEYSEHYSHISLIPFLCLYLLYIRRAAIFTKVEWSPFLGSILMAVGGAVSLETKDPISGTLDSCSSPILSFVMVCWGVFLLCYGIHALRAASFGLGLMVFMVPFPSVVLDAIVAFLQHSSSEATDLLFSVLGIPVFREGFVFSLSDFTIYVAEECSGIRSALALFITSLVASHLFLRSTWGKLGLMSIVVPLAIVKNAMRIVGLALLANYVDPSFITDSAVHRNGGIPIFALALAVLFSLVWLLRKVEQRFGYNQQNGSHAQV